MYFGGENLQIGNSTFRIETDWETDLLIDYVFNTREFGPISRLPNDDLTRFVDSNSDGELTNSDGICSSRSQSCISYPGIIEASGLDPESFGGFQHFANEALRLDAFTRDIYSEFNCPQNWELIVLEVDSYRCYRMFTGRADPQIDSTEICGDNDPGDVTISEPSLSYTDLAFQNEHPYYSAILMGYEHNLSRPSPDYCDSGVQILLNIFTFGAFNAYCNFIDEQALNDDNYVRQVDVECMR